MLIILAGVTLNLLMGDNGILTRAKGAKVIQQKTELEEYVKLMIYEWQMENASNSQELINFLENKKQIGEIEDVEKNGDEIEITKDNYIVIVDINGNIIQGAEEADISPTINNESIKITLEDGTEVEDYTQERGTKLKISFDVSIQEGEIDTVTPATTLTKSSNTVTVEYVTNGNEQEIEFTVIGTVGKRKKKKISVKHKYEKILEGESLLKIVEDNTFEDGVYKVAVLDEVYNMRIYNFSGDKEISENTSFGEASDVATESEFAKNMVVVKVNGNLRIKPNVTLTTVSSNYGGPKGFLIYCTGNLKNEGTISMTAKGAKAIGQNVYLWKNKSGVNEYEVVPADGADGGIVENSNNSAIAGENGVGRQTGGGASGTSDSHWGVFISAGSGTKGTSYSGGTGGSGAKNIDGSGDIFGVSGQLNGGAGGVTSSSTNKIR